jgi:septum formation protein
VDIDEAVRVGEDPATYVRRLAMEKSARGQQLATELSEDSVFAASAISAVDVACSETGLPRRLVVVGADTVVVVDGEILGKPRDDRDAERMLRLLSGRRHDVMTGVSLRCNRSEVGGVETTAVTVVRLSEHDLARYVASGEGRDKAGAYAIQGLASRFIDRIEGSYPNVVGLPVALVYRFLHDLASEG